ncbi:MAG TPA: HAMP domain-containing protein, partial [Kofleriaceae bacterium]|nr:HAMP domain-containing protein [Kofleriaceae bacterium]
SGWRAKLFWLLLVFSIAPMLTLAYCSTEAMERQAHESTLEAVDALAQAKAEALDQATVLQVGHVERVATLLAQHLSALLQAKERAAVIEGPVPKPPVEELPKLEDPEAANRDRKNAVPTPKAEPPPEPAPPPANPAVKEKLDALQQTLGLVLWGQETFEELLVIDATGVVVASTYPEHIGKSAAEVEYFKNGRRATYIQPVFHSPITEDLTMVIATPIRNQNYQQVGVLAARLNLKRFFRLIEDRTGMGATGETVVGKKIKDEVVFMAPTRHDAEAALRRKIPIGSSNGRALQEAARGQNGFGAQVDYRGVNTVAAWQNVPSLEWGLVVKIDSSEAVADAWAIRKRTLALGLVITLLVILASVVVSRALVEPLRTLKDATDRISRGDFAVELDIRSHDEIGELASSFERMVAAIKFFREHQRPPEDDEELAELNEAGEAEGGPKDQK